MTADTQAPAPSADAPPRDPRIRIVADAMCAKRRDLIAQPLSFIWEALAEAALAVSPTPSPIPADAHRALGHLYGIADAIEEAHPWKAGDIRQHANTITRALSAPAQSCVTTPLAGEAGAVEGDDSDMALIGRSFMASLDTITAMDGPYKDWTPAEDPAELVLDLYNDLIEAQESALSLSPPKAETETASGAERDDYITDAQARDLFGLEDDDDDLPEGRVRVCAGEWVQIPGGYYFDKSAGPLHPETATACDQCAVTIKTAPAETASERERLVEALREALAPFAREADEWADTVPDDYRSLCTEPGSETALPGSETAYTVGDLRRARSVYNASLSPPKAETETDTITNATVADIMAGIEVPAETASERERLVEALRSAVAQIEALCGPLDVPDDARAALAQEPAR